jgi:hypothetical protein
MFGKSAAPVKSRFNSGRDIMFAVFQLATVNAQVIFSVEYLASKLTCLARDTDRPEPLAPKTNDAPSRVLIKPAVVTGAQTTTFSGTAPAPRDVLIIASRLKEYVSARADFNTSASVMDVLSDYVRVITDHAIDNARAEGRKTLLDRDFSFLKKP